MIYGQTAIEGCFTIDLQRREDERGFFARMWCETEFAQQGLLPRISQINTGYSPRKGTLRGMHFQRAPHEEVKLVRCLRGAAFDVAVDLRPDSPTFKRWIGVELTGENGRMLYVPEGCAHGYLTLDDATELMYLTSNTYAPDAATGVRFDDPVFAIEWPGEIRLVSQIDRDWPLFTG